MLSRPADFAAIQHEGTLRSHLLFTMRIRWTGLDATRFGFAAGRRLGPAVVRNRARRRLRETVRMKAAGFRPGWDVLIVARPGLAEAEQKELSGALERHLRRGGVLGGPPDS